MKLSRTAWSRIFLAKGVYNIIRPASKSAAATP